MRGVAAVSVALWSACVFGQAPSPIETIATGMEKEILLVPLDSRPASGQFAQMIGRIAGRNVRMPTYESLGRFTDSGRPDEILGWLMVQDPARISDIIVSADMVCYGGLVASREHRTDTELAMLRLKKLFEVRKRFPSARFFVSSSTMRLSPTATRATAPWRAQLAKFVEARDRAHRLSHKPSEVEAKRLREMIPEEALVAYDAARARNHAVQRSLIESASAGQIDFLAIGQDDARPHGPHIPERARLIELVRKRGAGARVGFCEGIDQHASVLLSRALLQAEGFRPRIKVVASDPEGRHKVAHYESKPIWESLSEQVVSSGGALIKEDEECDYTLFLNTPKPAPSSKSAWLERLKGALDAATPIAVADINFTGDGAADSDLFETLRQDGRMWRLLSYAGWNTAGNTMGTSIPAANVALLSRRIRGGDAVGRELAIREFLLHRAVNDFAYHRYSRPVAYSMLHGSNRDESYGLDYQDMNNFVSRDIQKHLAFTIGTGLMGHRFFADGKPFEVEEIRDVKVWLPWPRAYEVRIEFRLGARPVVPDPR